jgi:3-phenylpropionate/cinnamic acid dioxygenase small subunit
VEEDDDGMNAVIEHAAVPLDAPAIDLQEAIAFVWHEADMLDRLDYRPWLDLWADEGLYIIPTERDVADYAGALNILYDDAVMREARVKRLLSGFSMSSAPPARTVRSVSRFVATGDAPGVIELRAAMIVAEYKYERMRTLAADVDYRLIWQGCALKLDRKVVRLVNCDDFLHGIGYLL